MRVKLLTKMRQSLWAYLKITLLNMATFQGFIFQVVGVKLAY